MFADYQAKLGTKNHFNKVKVNPPISWAKHLIKENTMKIWNSRWSSLQTCRQTKIWLPATNNKATKSFLKLGRKDLGQVAQLITGHNFLARHNSLLDPNISPTCRLCKCEDETSEHLIWYCPVLRTRRWEIFHETLEGPTQNWKPNQLISFALSAKMKELNKREAPSLPVH